MFINFMDQNNSFASTYCFGSGSFSLRHTVRTIISVTAYGSQFDAGRRSSKYPHLSSPTWRGIRIDAPRLAIPALN
jgi:hypothetical protein